MLDALLLRKLAKVQIITDDQATYCSKFGWFLNFFADTVVFFQEHFEVKMANKCFIGKRERARKLQTRTQIGLSEEYSIRKSKHNVIYNQTKRY